RRKRAARGRLPRLLPRERSRAADRRGARADEAGHRPAGGGVLGDTAGQSFAPVRTRPEYGRPPGGVRVRVRLEPVRARRAVPTARAGGRWRASRLRRATRQLGARRRALLPLQLLPVYVRPRNAVTGARNLEGGVRRLVRSRRLLPPRRSSVL